jgi:hypothetical protein
MVHPQRESEMNLNIENICIALAFLGLFLGLIGYAPWAMLVISPVVLHLARETVKEFPAK